MTRQLLETHQILEHLEIMEITILNDYSDIIYKGDDNYYDVIGA